MEYPMTHVNTTSMRLTAEQFRTLYLEHGRRAQGFFMRMMGYDVQLARDMVQDLFTRIWEHRDTFRADVNFISSTSLSGFHKFWCIAFLFYFMDSKYFLMFL